MKKESILLDTLPYIDMACLDLSKTQMQEFHYDLIQPQLKANLIYTDTDSLVYAVSTENVYKDFIKKNIEIFDTSDYAEKDIHDMPRVNEKVPLKLKDECYEHIIREFVGLRPKSYAFRMEDSTIVKRAKRVKAQILKRKITF